MGGELSDYEKCVLQDVDEHRRKQLERSPRRLMPQKVRDAANRVGGGAKKLPGADMVAAGYMKAAGGLTTAFAKAGQKSISPSRVVKAYSRRGHEVTELAHIRELDLAIVERKVQPRFLDMAYAGIASVEGAVAGSFITGGEVLFGAGTIAGVGAGGAPGLGTVTTAMAADTAITLTLMNRAVAHTALYYGYDPARPEETVFAMAVLGLGTATTSGAKLAAYQELSQLTQQLARTATWKQLNEHILPRIAAKVTDRLGFRLTQRKLGTVVPVAGILVGAGLNFALLDSVIGAAYWAYRERFIREKSGDFEVQLPAEAEIGTESDEASEGATEQPIDVFGIVEAVLAGESAEEADPEQGTTTPNRMLPEATAP